MIKKTLGTLALIGIAHSGANAFNIIDIDKPSAFSYNYVDINFTTNDDLNGLSGKASFDITPNYSIIGGAKLASDDYVDMKTFSFGAAFHQQVFSDRIENLDWIIHAEIESSFVDIEVGPYSESNTETGFVVGSGLRYWLIPKVELFNDVSLRTTGSTDVLLDLGARYHFSDNFSATTDYEMSDSNTLSLGLRYSFK